MRKRYLAPFLCISLFMLCRTLAYGQSLEGELLIRPALTSLRGNDVIKENLDPAFNVSVGAGVNFLVRENRLISVALLYERKGGRGEHNVAIRDQNNQTIMDAKGTLESNFHYILLPIQYGFRFGKKIQFEAGMGVYGGLLLKQETKSKVLHFDEEKDGTDDFKSFDFGASFSFSTYFPIKESLHLKIGLNDNLGLVNVSDLPVKDDGSIKHNSFGLVVGLNLKLR